MTKPLYFYNGTTFELVGPTTPQSPIAYQTSAPTAPATGDLWIDSDGDVDTYNRQLTRYYFVATAGQTSVSGVDANGLTLAYVAGSEAVYVNGALQVRGVDYTATNGTSITGLSALALNDVVEIFAYTAFTVANAYTKTETDGLVGAAPGLKLLTPTSIAVGSGSGSINSSGTITFSSASSVSLNGVFSSTYTTYRIVFRGQGTGLFAFNMRMRASGTDSSASYYWSGQYQASNTTSEGGENGSNVSSFQIGGIDNQRGFLSLDINNPFQAQPTAFASVGWDGTYKRIYAGGHGVTSAYDGVTIFPASSNITGTISVYGYKD